MTTTTTVGAADMDKPTIDTPEFRELMCNLGYWVDEDEADNDDCAMRLIAYIDAKLPAAAPADYSDPYALPKWIDDQKGKDPSTDDLIEHIIVLRSNHALKDAELATLRSALAAAAKEAPSDVKTWQERRAEWFKRNSQKRTGPENNDKFMEAEIAELLAQLSDARALITEVEESEDILPKGARYAIEAYRMRNPK